MKITDEKLADFHSRLSNWVSQQGFLFQLTNGSRGIEGRSNLLDFLGRAAIALLILAGVTALSAGAYLVYHTRSDAFVENLETSIGAALGADDIVATGFDRDTKFSQFRNIYAEGGEESFFTGLEARAVQFPMNLKDGVFGEWDAKRITIETLNLNLKAGASTDERADQIWQSLFQARPGFKYQSIEVRSASLTWGYSSPATWGSIIDAQLLVNKGASGLQISFQGGTFSQGILRGFEIERLQILAKPDGELIIQEAIMSSGDGTLTWAGKLLEQGASPVFEIQGTMASIPTEAFLLPTMQKKVSGRLTGTLTAKGSPNRRSGISYELRVEASKKDPIILSEAFPILQMASILDSERDYRRLELNQGSLTITTAEPEIQLSNIDLSAVNSQNGEVEAMLTGEMKFHPATMKDLSRASVAFNEIYEKSLEANPEALESVQEEFESEVRNRYQSYQPTERAFYYGIKRLADNGEELTTRRIEPFPRASYRTPPLAEGSLRLHIPYRSLVLSAQLPELDIPESGDLAAIRIEVNGFIPEIGQSLAKRWQAVVKSQSRPSQ